MRNLFFVFFINNILLMNIYPQNGWIAKSPKPQASNLTSVYYVNYVNENTVWAVGASGSLIKSTDGGINWLNKGLNSKYILLRIQFSDELNGVICGKELHYEPGNYLNQHGIVLTTNDGGETWTLKFREDIDLNDAFFINPSFGWAVGDSGKVFKTIDGGNSWIEYYCGVDTWIQEISFLDSLNGWIISSGQDGGVYKTTDGGISWVNVSPMFGNYFNCMYFISNNVGWVCGNSETYKTTDGGINWIQLSVSGGDIQFLDENNGWCVGYDPVNNNWGILKTSDGGVTWAVQNTDFFISSIHFINMDIGCAVGSFGNIITTFNGGKNWSNVTEWLPIQLNKVDFTSLNNGFAIGHKGYGYTATYFIIRTTDSGINWIISDSLTNSWFLDLQFVDEQNGWIVGIDFYNNNGIILNTNDGGNNWLTQYNLPNSGLASVFFIDDLKGFAGIAGSDGNLLFTTNGGYSWELKNTGHSIYPAEIFFINNNVGWIIGTGSSEEFVSGSSKIIKTTDGGFIWEDVSPQNLFDILYDIDFVDEQNGWVVGQQGILIKTTDGGLTWTQSWPEPWPFGPAFRSVDFVNENVGWLLSDDYPYYLSTIFYTTNGGNDWELQALVEGSDGSLFFLDENTGWYVGGHNISGEPKIGYIYKTTTGGATFIDVTNEQNSINKVFVLSQNYPNPFNPSTKISWQSPVGSWQTLKIYDLLGREVATLVDEYKPAGTYQVEWNASRFPSGVYFYQLNAEEFIQTNKMILIK